MQSKFKPLQNDQLFLLPPDVRDFIPKSHLSRVVSDVVDGFTTQDIEDQYSFQGQKSYHPRLLIKLWIYGYATGTLSGRQIAEGCETNTAFMYLSSRYCPDFRTLNDFRKNNINRFEGYFIEVIKLCRRMGMGKVGTISVDGTKIRGNVSAKNVKDNASSAVWLMNLKKKVKDLSNLADQINAEEDTLYGDKRGDELPEELQDPATLRKKIQEAMAELARQEAAAKNNSDKDCKMIKSGGKISPNYNCQGAVSLDGIIVGAHVSTNASDKNELVSLINQVEAITQERVENVLADGGYSSYENYDWLNKGGKSAYIPDQDYARRKEIQQEEPYHKSVFQYQKEHDVFICPEGKELTHRRSFKRKDTHKDVRVYRATACSECSVKSECTVSRFRSIYHDVREYLVDQSRRLLDDIEGKLLYKKRMATIEPVWGNIKFNKKITMFHLRGLPKVNGEWMLAALAHNIGKIRLNKLKMTPAFA